MNRLFTRKATALWVCLLILVLGLVSVAQAQLEGSTYFPLVLHEPTFTPGASITPTRTVTVTPTTRPPAVVISAILFPGTINERIEFTNQSGRAVNLNGWRVRIESDPNFRYIFQGVTLSPEEGENTVTLWTTFPGTDSSTNLFYGLSEPALKPNSDCVYLRDGSGTLVDDECLND